MKRKYGYVSEEGAFMSEAKKTALDQSLDPDWPTGVVVVKNNKIIGKGANGSEYHLKYGCERKRRGLPTGEGYEFCEGCQPKNHAEQKAQLMAGADVYMWGHWWCCEPCWQVMIDAGIKKVYLMKEAHVRFNKNRNSRIN